MLGLGSSMPEHKDATGWHGLDTFLGGGWPRGGLVDWVVAPEDAWRMVALAAPMLLATKRPWVWIGAGGFEPGPGIDWPLSHGWVLPVDVPNQAALRAEAVLERFERFESESVHIFVSTEEVPQPAWLECLYHKLRFTQATLWWLRPGAMDESPLPFALESLQLGCAGGWKQTRLRRLSHAGGAWQAPRCTGVADLR